jgi:hypothetical protein
VFASATIPSCPLKYRKILNTSTQHWRLKGRLAYIRNITNYLQLLFV